MFEKFSQEQLDRAEKLVFAAQAYSITSFGPMLERFPEMRFIPESGLLESWDYLIAVTAVGTAFMAIMDTLPEKDHQGMPYAVEYALNHWKVNAYSTMIDFLNHFNKLNDLNIEVAEAIGDYVWSELENNPKANTDLKEFASSRKLARTTGTSILVTFFNWWKS